MQSTITAGCTSGTHDVDRCFLCGSEDVRLRRVVIGLGIFHCRQYSFCGECLETTTAQDFWLSVYEKDSRQWPPEGKLEAGQHWDYGRDTEQDTEIHRDWRPATQRARARMTDGLRYRVMRRDGFYCVLCGATGQTHTLVLDHIMPVSRGGKTTMDNLRTVCRTCNSGKSDKIEGGNGQETDD